MVIVVVSGFIGRYLYVRIPRTLRGTELTQNELDARAAEQARAFAGANATVTLTFDAEQTRNNP